MSASRLDAVYRSILLTKFFTKGWGKPENLRRLFEFRKVVSNRDECYKLVEKDYPVVITKEQTLTDCKFLEGYFMSPLERYLPGIVPEIAQKAHFQALLPLHWPQPGVKPVCLHLAGTGDHFFWRRRNLMVKPLLKEAGIGGIILENPFYGLRKPTDQVRSSLHNVSDIFVMGGCLILEALVLFHWCERNGLGPLGVTGLSMGGHMASLAATNWPKPLVLVPCLSWSTASAVFLQGVMSHSINWDLLEDQYLSDGIYREKLSKMVTIIDEAFLAGKKFARTYAQTVVKAETDLEPTAAEEEKENNTDTLKSAVHAENATVKSAVLVENTTVKSADSAEDTTVKSAVSAENTNTKESKGTKHIEAKPDNANTLNIINRHIEESNPIKVKGNEIVDVSRNILELENTPKNVIKPEIFGQVEDLNKELKILLDQRQISRNLYKKLTSNKKFELEPEDIDTINKLSEIRIREILLKCRVKSAVIADPKKDSKSPKDGDDPPRLYPNNSLQSNNNELRSTPGIDKNPAFNHATAPTTALAMPPEKSVKLLKKSWNMADITSDLWLNWPFMRGSGKKIDISKIHWRDREALQFMRGIMDECTHLSNFTIPYDTSLIIAVCAKHDAYVPREDVGTLEEIWPGAEVRYVDAGHVSAYILHQSVFRACIVEAFERSKKKWKDGKHIIHEPPTA